MSLDGVGAPRNTAAPSPIFSISRLRLAAYSALSKRTGGQARGDEHGDADATLAAAVCCLIESPGLILSADLHRRRPVAPADAGHTVDGTEVPEGHSAATLHHHLRVVAR